MTRRSGHLGRPARLVVFLAGIACTLPAIARVAPRIPAFGDHPLPYADAVNARAPADRHVTNAVTAVNFDVRGFDTLGEEFMLLCAVTGVTVLLRGPRGELRSARPGRVEGRPIVPRTDAVLAAARLGAPAIGLFGLYVAIHGCTTPGGGFQAGVILATAALLVFLGDGYRTWRRTIRSEPMDAAEGIGTAVYALTGLAPLLAGLPFGTNILPLGTLKSALSGGTIFLLNAAIGLAVTGGFLVTFIEFLEETRVVPDSPDDGA